MIKLYDGQITDLLRNNPLQYDPEVMAMGYAHPGGKAAHHG